MKESDMIGSILGNVKGDKTPLATIREAQGKVESQITALVKGFEKASGVRVRYFNVEREQSKSKRKGDCLGGYGGALKAVTFDIDLNKE